MELVNLGIWKTKNPDTFRCVLQQHKQKYQDLSLKLTLNENLKCRANFRPKNFTGHFVLKELFSIFALFTRNFLSVVSPSAHEQSAA